MPVYEYSCPSCNCRFELLRPISRATEDAPCPECGASAPRAVSRFAAVSKGEDGVSAPVGGGGCASCGASSCDSCGG